MPSFVAPPVSVQQLVSSRCVGCWEFFVGSFRAVRLDPTRSIGVSSWWRSDQANQLAGGAPTSQHLVGTAVDLVGDGGPEVARQLQAFGWTWIPESDHQHLQVFVRNPFIEVF